MALPVMASACLLARVEAEASAVLREMTRAKLCVAEDLARHEANQSPLTPAAELAEFVRMVARYGSYYDRQLAARAARAWNIDIADIIRPAKAKTSTSWLGPRLKKAPKQVVPITIKARARFACGLRPARALAAERLRRRRAPQSLLALEPSAAAAAAAAALAWGRSDGSHRLPPSPNRAAPLLLACTRRRPCTPPPRAAAPRRSATAPWTPTATPSTCRRRPARPPPALARPAPRRR